MGGHRRTQRLLPRAQFDACLAGAQRAYGIVLEDVAALEEPFPLGFAGPQSFRYLFGDEPAQQAVLERAGLA